MKISKRLIHLQINVQNSLTYSEAEGENNHPPVKMDLGFNSFAKFYTRNPGGNRKGVELLNRIFSLRNSYLEILVAKFRKIY